MILTHVRKISAGLLSTSCATLIAAFIMSISPGQIDEAKALSVAYPGGHHFNHHKFRHKFHHRRHFRRHRHRFHFGFHGSRYYGPRYYGGAYYGGGYPVAQPVPVPVPVPVAPPVICPIPTSPPVVVTPNYPSYGGGAVGPVYRVFVPGGC